MTKSPWKKVPDVGVELGAACMPSKHTSDRATAPGPKFYEMKQGVPSKVIFFFYTEISQIDVCAMVELVDMIMTRVFMKWFIYLSE